MDWQDKAKIIHETVVKRWEPYSPEDWRFLALALAGEAGELANLVKKEWRGDIPLEHYRTEIGAEGPWRGAWLQAVTEEMVDIRIYLHLMALAFDVDLDAECAAKIPELLRRWPECVAAIAAAEAR